MKAENNDHLIIKLIFSSLYILIYPTLILWLSRDWRWLEGWLFNLWFLTLCFTSISYLYRRDPALLTERFQMPGAGGQKSWDKYVVYLLVIGFLVWFIIMPLDAKRYGWSGHYPALLKVLGFAGLVLSFFFFLRSFTDNTFLSPLVRIQTERHQQVVSTGVYGFVRHPMYLGAILLFLGAPLLLGSTYGLIFGLLLSLLLAFRIVGEEKMLLAELAGYAEYRKKVKYRLIPFVW